MKTITNMQKVEMLLKDYFDYKDIMQWFGKGKSWACLRLKEYQTRAIAEDVKLFKGAISTKKFIEYEEIDFDELVSKARLEKELGL